MEIHPSELGTRRNVALLRLRAAVSSGGANTAATFGAGAFLTPGAAEAAPGSSPRPPGPLGRWWSRGTGLPPHAVSHVLEGMKNIIGGSLGGLAGGGGGGFLGPTVGMLAAQEPLGAAVFGSIGAAMVCAGFSLPGILLRKWQRMPVTAHEIDTLLGFVQDDLERAYLILVQSALRRSLPADTQTELRGSLRALGEAIDRLPAHSSVPVASTDTLRRDAQKARADAVNETDPVVAASLERRAEALERSAGAVEQSAVLIRRMAALRSELLAQTEALRLGLTAFDTGAGHLSDLSHLAESVRGVADEAASVAAARGELDTFVSSIVPAGLRVTDAQKQSEAAVLRQGSSGG